ncbi:hypothetical protein R1flu_026822 [Riccia fluitans]|uniref:Uncharacterized protein n=1 Tax=Riccia fluitans TaxID=41844 RepID=A0ABD1XHM8_9MARC
MNSVVDEDSPTMDSDTNLVDTGVSANISEFVRAVLLGILTGVLALVLLVFMCVMFATWRRRSLLIQLRRKVYFELRGKFHSVAAAVDVGT